MITCVVGLRKVTYAIISPKMVNPRDIARKAEEDLYAHKCVVEPSTIIRI